jgi:hypothetical protein
MSVKIMIIGHRVDHEYGFDGFTGKKIDIGEVVATFDNKKDACQYIKNSRLKNPRNRERPFRLKSLLVGFEFATIEEHDDNLWPHNPQLENGENK